MRIIKPPTIRKWMRSQPLASAWLGQWLKVTAAAEWGSLQDVRATFPHADGVKVASGHIVTVFNVGRTGYRLITAIHYNNRRVFTMRLLSHADYDKRKWVKTL